MKNGDLLAYPVAEEPFSKGLTKREYFAAMAMQGMITDSGKIKPSEALQLPVNIAAWAVLFADALLAELEKPTT
jgi:hypothetical protein